MAGYRARTIKGGFFLNAQLGALPATARLCFAGMWTMADREGRLVDEPARIKAQCLPYDHVNVRLLLDKLEEAGFIRRYEHKGGHYIVIENWHRHQHPHPREAASILPRPKRRSPVSCKENVNVVTERTRRSPNVHTTFSPESPYLQGSLEEGHALDMALLSGSSGSSFPSGPSGSSENNVSFMTFYTAYPRHEVRVRAEAAWAKLMVDDRPRAIDAAQRLGDIVRTTSYDLKFIPHPATWLNQRRWEDWYDEGGQQATPPTFRVPAGLPHDRTTEETRPWCFVCRREMSADDVLEGEYSNAHGWRHSDCKEEP